MAKNRRAPRNPPLLRLASFSVRREVPLLDNIDWSVRARERWVILGPNGSGKSTLVNAISGYVVPSGGTMSVLGRTYGRSDWREVRADIGLVSSHIERRIEPDEIAADIAASGRGALLNTGAVSGNETRASALRALKDVGLSRLAGRPWAYLSQGERQRVLIARALVARPRLLILDEPCAGLDPVARAEFLRFVNIWGRGRGAPGLVLVTHHVEDIVPLFTHALILKSGRAAAQGTLKEVLTNDILSRAFDAAVHVSRGPAGYALSVRPGRAAGLRFK